MKYRFAVALATGFVFSTALYAQNPPAGALPPGATPGARPAASTGPKPYGEVITAKARTSRGLFTTHRIEDKFYFEIPDSLLEREILVVNRISKAPAGARAGFFGYAGDQISDNVISFEKGPNNKIFLRAISHSERGRDSTGMYQSVRNSNLQPINASFSIAAYKTDSLTKVKSSVIEVTEYISGDNDILFFDSRLKRALGLSQYQRDNSYILDVKSFPNNIEIQTVKTYMRTPTSNGFGAPAPAMAMPGSGSPSTFELNSSMVLLPKTAMKPRYFDPRIGYFATGYTDFDANPQGVENIRMITRWRLEPKPQDVDKYLRGELVEPAKQIVYYIDPATPRKWIPYLIQGVNDWNIAFEKAGWKNAIVAKEAPRNDPAWSLEGAGYSAIVYKPSDVANASGPHVHDPRSGEILESHINWYHNVMNLLRDWYFIQTAAVDPQARSMVLSDELMGQLIRFVSSHEVGHTLGLRHNYGSSSTVPVENLRNNAWLETNGHTPSIMDYARFNYVAQPEDNINQKNLFPRIGDYDIWAIEWGYRWMPQSTPEAEIPVLNKLTMERLKNKRLWFGTETDPDDPRGQNEDLSDDAIKASGYGIKNLQRIVAKLPEWTKQANKDYSSLGQMYSQLRGQFQRYMGHVAKSVGGIYTTPKMTEEAGVVVEFVSEAKQKAAMQFLHEQLFKTPKWLVDNNISDYTGDNKLTTVGNIQNNVLNRLLGVSTFTKLARFEAENPANAYTAHEMVTDLRKGIWSELVTKQPIDIYRRGLQKSFVETLDRLINPPASANVTIAGFGAISTGATQTSDAISVAKAQLRQLQGEIRAALPVYKDVASRAHLQDVVDRITEALNPNK
ncbi:MAG: zinc-dependent metalloprotease [Flavisolibacter sp.]